MKHILEKYNNVRVTVAGAGPDLDEMRRELQNDSRVRFTRFSASDSLNFHENFDIAVVPTIGSEGTSLSLLEAMAAGCAVVASDVGGMTNVVLNGFNGILVQPEVKDVEQAVERLVRDKNLRERLSLRAEETVKNSFSLSRWKQDWTHVITDKIKS